MPDQHSHNDVESNLWLLGILQAVSLVRQMTTFGDIGLEMAIYTLCWAELA